MLTRVATKVSLFAAFITFVYCVVTDISMAVSFTRALVVFAGFYLILIAFFITLRFIFGRRKKEEDEQIGVPQDKVTPLVAGKASRETDRQHVRIQHFLRAIQFAMVGPASLHLSLDAISGKDDKLFLAALV